jgi:hydrogenase nickel incorporation protein HypA/HybF
VHELAICQSIISQVETLAQQHQAKQVVEITLKIGLLAGVEGELLKQAFPLAAAGGCAENAELKIESIPVKVKCSQCHAESEVVPNRLLCQSCGDWRTKVISGDEMLLARIEFLQ